MPTLYADAEQREKAAASADFLPLFWVLLSYRTPMKMRELLIYKRGQHSISYFRCPRCQTTLEREYTNFCDRCGQSLNWKGCQKATKIYIGHKR